MNDGDDVVSKHSRKQCSEEQASTNLERGPRSSLKRQKVRVWHSKRQLLYGQAPPKSNTRTLILYQTAFEITHAIILLERQNAPWVKLLTKWSRSLIRAPPPHRLDLRSLESILP